MIDAYITFATAKGAALADVPPRPAEIDAILRLNRGRAQAASS